MHMVPMDSMIKKEVVIVSACQMLIFPIDLSNKIPIVILSACQIHIFLMASMHNVGASAPQTSIIGGGL